MPIDFKASQIRTNKIIASGSIAKPYLLIYPSGSALNDSGALTKISGTGSDGWLFVSGGINSNEKVVFGGDTTISGTFIVSPNITEPLIYATASSNPTAARVGIKRPDPESTFHIGGTNEPGFLADTGAIINYGRNNSSSSTFLVQGKYGGDHGLLVVSASSERVAIGKHNPNAKLDVYGDGIFSGSLRVTSSLIARSMTGSIQYVDEAMTTDFLIGNATFNASTGQWTIGAGGGGDSYFISTTSDSIYTTGATAFAGGESVDSPYDKGSDVFFYVSGSTDGSESALFGGNLVVSGSTQHLDDVQITGSLSATGSLTDLQSSTVNISTLVSSSSINIGATGNLTDVVVAGDGKLQFLSNIGGSPFGAPPAGSIQLLAKTVGGVGFNPAGGEFVAESANGMVLNTNGHMKFQMNSLSNETLEIRSSNIFSSTPNIQIRSDGNSATNSIDITSDNAGGISLGSNSSYNTGDILIGQQAYQRTIKLGNVSSAEQYIIIGSEFGNSYTAISGSAIITGNTTLGNSSTDTLVVSASLDSNIVPSLDSTYTLGTPNYRFAHVYTGDLHLRNDRGDWTMIEEDEYLTIRNNKTGKRYKLSMTPLDD